MSSALPGLNRLVSATCISGLRCCTSQGVGVLVAAGENTFATRCTTWYPIGKVVARIARCRRLGFIRVLARRN